MPFMWIIAGVICGWAVLRVIGAERERRVRDLQHKMAAAAAGEISKAVGSRQ